MGKRIEQLNEAINKPVHTQDPVWGIGTTRLQEGNQNEKVINLAGKGMGNLIAGGSAKSEVAQIKKIVQSYNDAEWEDLFKLVKDRNMQSAFGTSVEKIKSTFGEGIIKESKAPTNAQDPVWGIVGEADNGDKKIYELIRQALNSLSSAEVIAKKSNPSAFKAIVSAKSSLTSHMKGK